MNSLLCPTQKKTEGKKRTSPKTPKEKKRRVKKDRRGFSKKPSFARAGARVRAALDVDLDLAVAAFGGTAEDRRIWAAIAWRVGVDEFHYAVMDKLAEDAADGVVACADFWLECFDQAESKRLVVERAMLAGKRVFSASGMGGFGGPAMARRDLGLLTVVGDFVSDIADHPPLAPRVTQAAAMMADAVVEWVLS